MAESVLDRIIERKRGEVASRLAGVSADARPTSRSLAAALRRPGARFIMEVKRASPSGHRSGHSVEAAARAYAPVADAISVLTDGPDFGGRLEDIAVVREHFDGPILAKDFIVDARQVAEARRFGADAVLVILSALEDASASEVIAEARRLGMDAIVEVHDAAEMSRAIALQPAIIGINNRDLRTLQTDLDVTRQLAAQVPHDIVLISESGIASRSDAAALAPLVDGFLVGSVLMAAHEVADAARALVHGRVKLCGLTRDEDVEAAAACGATHAGLILVPGTPRALGLFDAQRLAAVAAGAGLKSVGVFRDADPAQVLAAAELIELDVVQLHGREPDSDIARIRGALEGRCEVWAACAVEDSLATARPAAHRLVFDTAVDGRAGGTGRTFDWESVRGHPLLERSLLAGGIRPDNAASAAAVGAYALDVSSGVESAPGVKDRAMLQDLFAQLRLGDRRAAPCG